MNSKIAAVVVTYNRLELLKKCIDSLRNQTRKLNEIIVVNNSSTDGTSDWLVQQKDLTVITQENSGSAGGQYTGIKTAYEKGYDLIWSLDTDVIPYNDALEKLLIFIDYTHVGFLSSNIFYTKNELAHANIPELDKPYEFLSAITFNKPLPILTASFGSLLVKREVIKKVGLPCKEFFIWGDDAEWTLRIRMNGFKGYLVLESKALHLNEENQANAYSNIDKKSKKFLCGVRNLVYVSIQRNILTHNSKLRGYLSALGFIYRVYTSNKQTKILFNINLILILLKHYIKGIFFKPKIDFPSE